MPRNTSETEFKRSAGTPSSRAERLPPNIHDTRASEADVRRMTGSSVGADRGSPYI